MSPISQSQLQELSHRLKGPVYTSGDPNYASEIACFNAAVTHTPDVVVSAFCQEDILETVRFAKREGFRVTVQATGHGALDPIASGVMISTRSMNKVEIDPLSKTACIEAGATWKQVIELASLYGLTPICGSSVSVGVVGYLLGGGVGPLARSNGFSSDYLTAMSVVTGTGELLRASEEENNELFWALRGGKIKLGIVTKVCLRLVSLQTLYAGSIVFEEKEMEKALRAWAAWTKKAHPLVATSMAIVCFPNAPFIPEKFRDRRLLTIRFAYPGSREEGEKLAHPLRTSAPVYIDMLGELPVSNIGLIHNDPPGPIPFWSCGVLLTHIDQDFITAVLDEFGAGSSSPFSVIEIRHLGSAASCDVITGSAVGGRSAEFVCSFVGKNPQQCEDLFSWRADALIDAFRPWVSQEGNINLVGKAIPGKHFASLWPKEIIERLQRAQKRYNPSDIF